MRNKTKNKKTYDQLIAGYYGKSKLFRNKSNPDFVISKSFDNGEVLVQKSKNVFLEYVVQSSAAIDTPFEEYIVSNASESTLSQQSSMDITSWYAPTQSYTAAQETQTDLTNPLQDDNAKLAMLDRLNDPSATDNSFLNPTFDNNSNITSNQNTTDNNPYNKNTAVQSSLFAEVESLKDLENAKSSEDDFVRDMQDILTGKKVFNPLSKKTEDKSQLNASSKAQSEAPAPLPPLASQHAIFDQIAERMEYAKAYDLGSIDLEKRFNDFDRISEIEKKIPAEKKSSVMNEAMSIQKSAPEVIGNEEFIQDLDAIAKAANAKKIESASETMSKCGCSDKQITAEVSETNKTAVVPQAEQVNNVQPTT